MRREKTRKQLLDEIADLKQRLAGLECRPSQAAVASAPGTAAQYRATLDAMGDAIHVIDTGYCVILANKSLTDWCEKLGISSDVVGKNIFAAYPFLPLEIREEYEGVFASGKPLLTEETTSVDHNPIITETRKIPICEGGKVAYIITIMRDVTASKNAMNALRDSEEKFRVLAEKSPNMIFINKKGRVVYVNEMSVEIMGYHKEEFYAPDFNFLGLIAPSSLEAVKANFAKHMNRQDVPPYEYTLLTKGRREIAAILTTRLIRYEDGTAILGIVTDISDRKKLEEEIIKSQKLESIGMLAGGIAHDFNNILTGILGNISLARSLSPPPGPVDEILSQAEKSSRQATKLTQQLLTFAKGGAPVKKPVPIQHILQDSAILAGRGSQVRFSITTPEIAWTLEVDEGQINQVMNNLILNAVQAMPHGGLIDIRAEAVFLEKDQIPTLPRGNYVQISVADQGVGILESHLHKLFEPYFTTKPQGTGLGLAIAYSIIKRHNGYISVESRVGMGTTFCIYLPATADSRSAVEEPPPRAKFTGQGKILFMDDENPIRILAERMLKKLGFTPYLATNGAEVIERYREALALQDPFAAVILDLTVAGGPGGLETFQKLSEIDPRVKAIVSSGYSNDPVLANADKFGFSGILVKPYTVEELSSALQLALERQP